MPSPLKTQNALPGCTLAKDRRTSSLLQLHPQPFADCELFVVAVLLGIFRLFELSVFLLIDWLLIDHVNDHRRILILQKLRSLVRIKFDAVNSYESGQLSAFPGINERKWFRRLWFVAGVLGGLNELDSFLNVSVYFFF